MSACAPISAGERAGTPPIFSNSVIDAAAIAEDPVAALDQVFRDRQADLAHPDETDGLHGVPLNACSYGASLLEIPLLLTNGAPP